MKTNIELSKPINAHGEEVTSLTFRELNFGMMMQLDNVKGEMAKVAKIIEMAAQIPASSVKELSMQDVTKITEEMLPFLGLSPATGQNAELD